MPVKRGKREGLICILSTLVILSLDQASKLFIHLNFSNSQSMPIIKNILYLTFVRNTGGAFGLFKHSTLFFIVVSIIASGMMLFLIVASIKKAEFLDNLAFNFGLILIMSGALGNLIDRIKFGYVVDFIDVRIWPVFNIADSSITIGTLILAISFMRSKAKPQA